MRRKLIWYALRRLVVLALLLIPISFAVFSLQHIAPGSVVDTLLGPNTPRDSATIETIKILEEKYHLNEPFLVQYWIWLKDAAQFQFGDSIHSGLPVTDEIESRWPTSAFLAIYAFGLTMIAGIALGVVAAVRRYGRTDRAVVAGAVVGLSTPVFVTGVLLLYVFAIVLPWFPVFGRGSGFSDGLWHMTLPAAALAISSAALVLKHTRAATLGVLDQDYVTFARARGLSSRRILLSYVLRNSLIPIITIGGILLTSLIVGAVLVESTFTLPGLGGLLVQAATLKDLPVLQAVALLIAIVVVIGNLIADLAVMIVDPRVRYRVLKA